MYHESTHWTPLNLRKFTTTKTISFWALVCVSCHLVHTAVRFLKITVSRPGSWVRPINTHLHHCSSLCAAKVPPLELELKCSFKNYNHSWFLWCRGNQIRGFQIYEIVSKTPVVIGQPFCSQQFICYRSEMRENCTLWFVRSLHLMHKNEDFQNHKISLIKIDRRTFKKQIAGKKNLLYRIRQTTSNAELML